MNATSECRPQPGQVGFELLGVEEAGQVRGGGPPRPILDIPVWINPPVPPIVAPSPVPLPLP